MTWTDVMSLADLDAARKRVVRVDGRHILLLATARGVFACPNRCPHEGYPLAEGDCSEAGTLRCNWHNWTFDLTSGETLVGADRLPQYPVRIEAGRVLVGSAPDDSADVRRRARAGISAALDDADHARLLRETARLERAGGDRADALRDAVGWLAPRLQFGTTHAIAGAADWLALADAPSTPADEQLAALGEILGHIADDGRRERRFPFADATAPWDAPAFVHGVETGDEATVIARINGALAEQRRFADLVPVLAEAALAHYADFGHSLIYVVKSAELAARLGAAVDAPLLQLLVRSLCFATREDLLPEFRAYRPAVERLQAAAPGEPARAGDQPELIRTAPVTAALERVVAWARTHPAECVFRALVDSAAFTLLHVDESTLTTTSGSIANNASWLNFTHAITFADAGARVAGETPALWPAILAQLACFIGRSNGFVDPGLPVDAWRPADPAALFRSLRAMLFDHGRDRFIISVHLIKTLFAAERLVCAGHADATLMAAALNRFYHVPMKGRHVLRTARQMLALVEG